MTTRKKNLACLMCHKHGSHLAIRYLRTLVTCSLNHSAEVAKNQNLSNVMRKPVFHICEKKGRCADLHSNCTADQHLCFRYKVRSVFLLIPKFQASSHLLWLSSLVCVSDQVGNPEERFSNSAAHLIVIKYTSCLFSLG